MEGKLGVGLWNQNGNTQAQTSTWTLATVQSECNFDWNEVLCILGHQLGHWQLLYQTVTLTWELE